MIPQKRAFRSRVATTTIAQSSGIESEKKLLDSMAVQNAVIPVAAVHAPPVAPLSASSRNPAHSPKIVARRKSVAIAYHTTTINAGLHSAFLSVK